MPASRGVLALDLGSRVGWAYGCPGDERPLCGTWILPAGLLGRYLCAFENELDDALILHQPAMILAEAPLPPTAISNALVWQQQMGLHSIAASASYRHGVEFRQQSSYDIRAFCLGRGRFPKGTAKDHVMAYCNRRGWRYPDDHAADACVTWEYGCHHFRNVRRAVAA